MKVLTAEEITGHLAGLPGWELRDGAIRRAFATSGWPSTMLVVNAIAYAAEAAGHHPDLLVRWSSVEVALWTHSAKAITVLDIETAALIEQTVSWRPGPDSDLAGPPTPLVIRPD